MLVLLWSTLAAVGLSEEVSSLAPSLAQQCDFFLVNIGLMLALLRGIIASLKMALEGPDRLLIRMFLTTMGLTVKEQTGDHDIAEVLLLVAIFLVPP